MEYVWFDGFEVCSKLREEFGVRAMLLEGAGSS
jgi:hypothetical protein